MPIIDLEQGSPEWLEYRKCHIMATDASVILGINPWKTALELWEEKLDISPPQKLNDAMKRGQLLEPEARKIASDEFNTTFTPYVIQSDDRPWQAASLDGLSTRKSCLLEIKCPGEKTHQMAVNGVVPHYYIPQILHQFAVTACTQGYYMSYRPEDKKNPFIFIEVEIDERRIEEIIGVEQYFYENNLCRMKEPRICIED